MIVNGKVTLLSCLDCGASHPHFQFCGDNDMATDGLWSAGDREGSRLALFRATRTEMESGNAGSLRSARLIGTRDSMSGKPTKDFAEFLRNYQPAELIFQCPWCDGENMTVSSEMDPSTFVAAGGTIDCIGDIELSEESAAS